MADDEAPIAKRRTPRKSIAPSRLGLDDDWADVPAGKWTPSKEKRAKPTTPSSKPKTTSEEAAPVVADKVVPVPPAPEGQAPIASVVEGALLSALGDFICQSYVTNTALDTQRILVFAIWGAMVTLFVSPYTNWITSFKLSDSPVIDGALKSVVNQFLLNSLLTALFIVFYALIVAGLNQAAFPSNDALVALVKANFYSRWEVTAQFWLAADALNLLIVPTDLQLLFGSFASVAWGVANSWLTK